MTTKKKAAAYDRIKADGKAFLARIDKIEDSLQAYPLMNIYVGKVLTVMDQWQGDDPAPDYNETSEDTEPCGGYIGDDPLRGDACGLDAGHEGDHVSEYELLEGHGLPWHSRL